MLSRSSIKYIQSLHQKKFREAENLFVIEGPKIVQEALTSPEVTVKEAYGLQDWVNENSQFAEKANLVSITAEELERISQLKAPNKVLALVEIPWREGFVLQKNNIALALDCIQDPGNMGTIIRIADWFNIKQIICSVDCADIYNSKVVQASMGSIFRVEVFYTELAEWLTMQKETTILGATFDGTPLRKMLPLQNGILVIGNESKGISNPVMQMLQQKITIEKYGNAESLNAAVATGIILSHLKA